MSASISLEGRQKKIIPGRALYVAANGDLYLCRGCQIYRSCDRGQTWLLDCYVPSFGWKHHCSRVRVLARLLRWYIAALHVLPDGSRLAIARDGIYRAAAGEQQMTRVFKVERGSRPLNFSVDGSRVLFGEYGSGLENSEVLIYVSEDSGQSFQAGFRFSQGDIRHVHHVMVDPFDGNYWVLVGDFGRQTGVGVLSRDLKHLEWLGRGTQRYRAVSALIDRDGLTYGTDSDRDHNFIVRLDRKTGRIEELLQVEGSSLYAAQFGSLRLISTAVEPNPYCRSRECCLYGSTEGGDWQRLAAHRKDVLSPVYFQFGALVLPYTQQTRDGQSPSESDLMYSGQAVTGLDGRVALIHGNREPATWPGQPELIHPAVGFLRQTVLMEERSMSTANTSSVAEKFTESEVIGLVAEALDVPASTLNSASKAVDVPEWDSMGILGILSVLDREGIKCDIGNTESLQSIAGILETCRSAGRLK